MSRAPCYPDCTGQRGAFFADQYMAGAATVHICLTNRRICLTNLRVSETLPISRRVMVLQRRVLEHYLDQTGPALCHGLSKGLIQFRHGLDFARLHAHASGDICPL